jgi:hypothetical protein
MAEKAFNFFAGILATGRQISESCYDKKLAIRNYILN